MATELQALSDEFLTIRRPHTPYPGSLEKLERLQERKYNISAAKRRLKRKLREESLTQAQVDTIPLKRLKIAEIRPANETK